MTYPLVEDLAADGIGVAVTCRVLGFSKQAFFAWKRSPVSRRDLDDAYLINVALDIHHDDPAFGHRFIADELPAHGITAGLNRVARLCSQQRIWSVLAKKRGLTRRARNRGLNHSTPRVNQTRGSPFSTDLECLVVIRLRCLGGSVIVEEVISPAGSPRVSAGRVLVATARDGRAAVRREKLVCTRLDPGRDDSRDDDGDPVEAPKVALSWWLSARAVLQFVEFTAVTQDHQALAIAARALATVGDVIVEASRRSAVS